MFLFILHYFKVLSGSPFTNICTAAYNVTPPRLALEQSKYSLYTQLWIYLFLLGQQFGYESC